MLDGTPAEKAVTLAVYETTGGGGTTGLAFFQFLAEREFPGDPKDDPSIRRSRQLWVSRERKRHTCHLVKIKHELMVEKYNIIRRKRAFASSVPRGESPTRVAEVGVRRFDLKPSVSGLPARAGFDHEAESNVFDGPQKVEGLAEASMVSVLV